MNFKNISAVSFLFLATQGVAFAQTAKAKAGDDHLNTVFQNYIWLLIIIFAGIFFVFGLPQIVGMAIAKSKQPEPTKDADVKLAVERQRYALGSGTHGTSIVEGTVNGVAFRHIITENPDAILKTVPEIIKAAEKDKTKSWGPNLDQLLGPVIARATERP